MQLNDVMPTNMSDEQIYEQIMTLEDGWYQFTIMSINCLYRANRYYMADITHRRGFSWNVEYAVGLTHMAFFNSLSTPQTSAEVVYVVTFYKENMQEK